MPIRCLLSPRCIVVIYGLLAIYPQGVYGSGREPADRDTATLPDHAVVIAVLAKAVSSGSFREARMYSDVVRDLGIEAEATDRLLSEIPTYEHSDESRGAFDVIGSFGRRASNAIPRLLEYLENGPPAYQCGSAKALRDIGVANANIRRVVRQCARGPDAGVAAVCTMTLCKLDPDDRGAADRVLELAKTLESPYEQSVIVRILGGTTQQNPAIDRYTAAGLESDNVFIRIACADAMLSRYYKVEEASEALSEIASTTSGGAWTAVRLQAARALAKHSLKFDIVGQAVDDALLSTSPYDRRGAILVLREIPEMQDERLTLLLRLTADEFPFVRSEAAAATGDTVPNSDDVRAALVRASRDGTDYVRWRAIAALNRIKRRNGHNDAKP